MFIVTVNYSLLISELVLMKISLKSIALMASLAIVGSTQAQDCIVPISVELEETFSQVDAASIRILENQLRRAATATGLNADGTYTQFMITAKVDVLDKEVTSTAPAQVVQNLGVTLYIADQFHQKTFASEYIELKGVGKSEEKSFNFALRQLNGQNSKLRSFINQGKRKILDYYDSQTEYILKDADRAASMQNYEQAISLCASVPTCSKGADQAAEYGAQLYAHYRDLLNQKLILQAQALWAAGQDPAAASEAAYLLASVDPESGCYAEAQALLKEIKTQMRSDRDFEMREKYWAENKLEGQRIDAWRQVGIAVGKGPKAQTNLMWMGR